MSSLLISGTDTDVGKTVATCALMAYQQQYLPDQNWAICKPLQSGIGDREQYQQLFNLQQSQETLNPLYFQQPLAPPLAAEQEGKHIDLAQAWHAYHHLYQNHDHVLVEGVGGLGSPITWELTVADLTRDWRLPIVLVVPVQLGAIGQAVANVALARQAQLSIRGIILSCTQPYNAEQIANWASRDLLESLTQVPVLGTLPYFETLTDLKALATAAANLDLEQLWATRATAEV